jgi:signal transduction histidine kinase
LLTALRKFYRDSVAPDDPSAADAEMAFFQLQKLVTLGQLATEIAHDFGNLTTVMLGYCELLLATTDPVRPERVYMAELHRAAERASALTTQLLSFSRQTSATPAPTDLAAVIQGIKSLLTRVVGQQIQLTIATKETPRPAMADPRLVEQVMVNLALNARDALPSGGHVEVTVEPVRLTASVPTAVGQVSSGEYVRVSINDDGCGMSADTYAQLFRPFFTTKPRRTGLGLTIVARIARQCGAAIEVQSAPNRGTTLSLYFPVLAGR